MASCYQLSLSANIRSACTLSAHSQQKQKQLPAPDPIRFFVDCDNRPDFRGGQPLTSTSFPSSTPLLQSRRISHLISYSDSSDVEFDEYDSDFVTDDDDSDVLSWNRFRPPSSKREFTSESSFSDEDELGAESLAMQCEDESRCDQALQKFNPLDFARVYDMVGLRVPLAEWRDVAYRLKGHLLNWPRIDNVSRVEGDDLDSEIKVLLNKERKAGSIKESVQHAVYGTTVPPTRLERHVKAAGKLNRRLEHISRLGRRTLKEIRKQTDISGPESNSRLHRKSRKENLKNMKIVDTEYHRRRTYSVEVIDQNQPEINGDTKCLMMKKWNGPFRILLLDTKYIGRPVNELPMAVQVLIGGAPGNQKATLKRELVTCKLTLFYDYWTLDEVLMGLLPEGKSEPPKIHVIGHMAQLRLGKQFDHWKHLIGKVILDKQRPKVKTVINMQGKENELSTRPEVLAGNHSLVTSIAENGILFHINLATVYLISEHASERKRLIQKFSERDIVCDVCAGVGTITIPAAKKVWRVFANDENVEALKYLEKNVIANQIQAKVELYNMEGGEFLRTLLSFTKPVLMTQIVLGLPYGEKHLDGLIGVFNMDTWSLTRPLPMVHVYGYAREFDPEGEFLERISQRIGVPLEAVETFRVQQLQSGGWVVVASFRFPKIAAFHE